jgi:hypothetical protein
MSRIRLAVGTVRSSISSTKQPRCFGHLPPIFSRFCATSTQASHRRRPNSRHGTTSSLTRSSSLTGEPAAPRSGHTRVEDTSTKLLIGGSARGRRPPMPNRCIDPQTHRSSSFSRNMSSRVWTYRLQESGARDDPFPSEPVPNPARLRISTAVDFRRVAPGRRGESRQWCRGDRRPLIDARARHGTAAFRVSVSA